MEIVKKNIGIIIFIVIWALLLSTLYSLNPLGTQKTFVDSEVFIYIGQNILEGEVPYKDNFDHKGPLIYFLNAFGILIGNGNLVGIWIIEFIFLLTSILISYKITRLFSKNRILCAITVMLATIPIVYYGELGNLVEEYALPFILISLYYFFKYMQTSQLSSKEAYIIGISAGMVCMLRVNMVSVWIAFCLVIFIKMLIKKEFKELLRIIIFAVLGGVTAILPFVIYLLINGAFEDFIQQYIVFNIKYSNIYENTLKNTFEYFFYNKAYIIIVFIGNILGILIDKKNRLLASTNLLYLILTIILVVLPRRGYWHYAIIILPCYIYPIITILNAEYDIIKKHKKLLYIFVIIFSLFIIQDEITYASQIFVTLNMQPKQENNFVKYIKANTTEEDEILVIGNICDIYLDSNRKAASKYFYQSPIGVYDENIMKQVVNDVKNNRPKIIVLTGGNLPYIHEYLDELLQNNQYSLIEDSMYVRNI